MNEARILYTVGKKDFILQSKGAHLEKFRRRATRGEITLRFLAALRAAQHGLYTSNLLPTPMLCVVSIASFPGPAQLSVACSTEKR